MSHYSASCPFISKIHVVKGAISTNDKWAGNGDDTIGSVIGMTPTDLALWNSTVTHENETERQAFLSQFKASLVSIPDDRLRVFNDGPFLVELKKQTKNDIEKGAYRSLQHLNLSSSSRICITILSNGHLYQNITKDKVPSPQVHPSPNR